MAWKLVIYIMWNYQWANKLKYGKSICSWFFYRTWLRYVYVFATANLSACRLSVCLSVICYVCAPYSWAWNFWQYFSAILYLSISLTYVKLLRRSSQGNPSAGGVKRKRVNKMERYHVRVFHLMSFLCQFVTTTNHSQSFTETSVRFDDVKGRCKAFQIRDRVFI